jgi:hypothetical protein
MIGLLDPRLIHQLTESFYGNASCVGRKLNPGISVIEPAREPTARNAVHVSLVHADEVNGAIARQARRRGIEWSFGSADWSCERVNGLSRLRRLGRPVSGRQGCLCRATASPLSANWIDPPKVFGTRASGAARVGAAGASQRIDVC